RADQDWNRISLSSEWIEYLATAKSMHVDQPSDLAQHRTVVDFDMAKREIRELAFGCHRQEDAVVTVVQEGHLLRAVQMAETLMNEGAVDRVSSQEFVVVTRDYAIVTQQQRPAHSVQNDTISVGYAPKRPDRIVVEIRPFKVVAQNLGMQGVDR